MGRPATYADEHVDAICARIATGETLASICRDEDMPGRSVVYDWIRSSKAVAGRFERAREVGFDAIADETLAIADDGSNDTYLDSEGGERTNTDVIARSKLRVETRLKLLSKWHPAKYGERLTHAGDPAAPIHHTVSLDGLTDDQLRVLASISLGDA